MNRHTVSWIALASIAAAAAAAFAAPAVAQTVTLQRGAATQAAVDFAGATPMVPRINNARVSGRPNFDATMDALESPKPSTGGREGLGRADARALATEVVRTRYEEAATPQPEAYGTDLLHFTTGRSAVNTSSQKANPLGRTGRLFFNTPSGTSWCSASMIRPGVLVTAGHCVANGSGTWYSGFTYVPAYRSGAAPYGTWTNWLQTTTSNSWFNGGGAVPNLQDYAVIVFDRDGNGNRIGDYTGWMGWWTNRAIGRHITTVGYPGNMYGGEVQVRTDSLAYDYGTNNVYWGSDQRGGSSGSPLVVNLRSGYDNTAATPTENDGNRVSATISWGWVSTAPMAQGASVFDSLFAQIMTDVCTAFPTIAC